MIRQLAPLVLFVAGLLFCGAALTAWRRRGVPGANLFGAVAGVTGVGALVIAASLWLDLPRAVVLGSTALVALVHPIPWFMFSVEYTGRTELVSAGVTVVIATVPGLGVLATVLVFGVQVLPWLTLPSPEAAGGLAVAIVALLATIQWLALLYAGGLMVAGTGVLLWTFHRYSYLDAVSGTLLCVFGAVPWLSLILGFQVGSIEPRALQWTVTVGFLAGGVATSVGLGRSQLFQRVPAAGNVGPRTVMAELEDTVIVTDDDSRVVKVNPAAEQALDVTAANVIGDGVTGLLDEPLSSLQETETIEVQSDTGRGLFEPRVSELTDQHGQRLGSAIVLRDVTARTTRQQRLDVLNRVLRHNLRNDMTVINGHAERLRENVSDPDLADCAETIVTVGRGLTDFAEDAREIDNLMATAETSSREFALAPLAEDVLNSTLADHRRVTAACRVPADLVVVGSSELLELALTNLVENAVEHNDTDTPLVELEASYDPDRTYPLTVSVLDDGPGIPDLEREPIEAGTETSLQHGTGLGLWVARFAVTRLGGTIVFDSRESRGTRVSLHLPRARRDETEAVTSSVGTAE